MLDTLTITNLGAHARTVLRFDPTGVTEITGPSECGKTTVVRALVWLLSGKDEHGKPLATHHIRDDESKAEVSALLANGVRLYRSQLRSGSTTRKVTTKEGVTTSYSSEAKWSEAIKPLGAKPDAVRLVLAPMAWAGLAHGNGRGLRDVLSTVLPPADLGEEIGRLMIEMRHHPIKGDPTTEKGAIEDRRDANRTRDEARGRLDAARDAVEVLEGQTAEPVSTVTIAAAQAAVWVDESWVAHTKALETFDELGEIRDVAVGDHDRWSADLEALGDPPQGPTDLGKARGDLDTASKAVAAATDAVDLADRTVKGIPTAEDIPDVATARNALHKARKDLSAAPQGDDCPTCGKRWAAAKKLRAEAERAVEAAHRRLTTATTEADEYLNERLAIDGERLAIAGEEMAKALTAERLAVDYLAGVEAPRKDYERAVESIGDEPAVPDEPTRPSPPIERRPSADILTAACETLQLAQASAALAVQRGRDLETARQSFDGASKAHSSMVLEATRLDALVSAVRQAPSEIAKRQSKALGDLGPVALRWGSGSASDPAVSVLIDGRPWILASTGRRIVADAWLRAGIRRALGLAFLPLFVDEVQSVRGQALPEIAAPVVLLRGTDTDGIGAGVV